MLVDCMVRPLSRRHRPRARHRRRSEKRHDHPHDERPSAKYLVDRTGVFTPKITNVDDLGPRRSRLHHRADQGSRRHDALAIRSPRTRRPTAHALPGFSNAAQPVVFCGLFPVDAADFEDLRAAMGKLRLNDASFSYEMETIPALGFGFRYGFLGCCFSKSFRNGWIASSIST